MCCQILVLNSTCKSVFILNIQHTELLPEAKSMKTILSYLWQCCTCISLVTYWMMRGFLSVIQQVEISKIIFHFLQKTFFHAHSSRTSSTYPHALIHKQYQQQTKNALWKQLFVITNPLQISNYLPKRPDNNHSGCGLGWGRVMNRGGR